MVSSAVKELVLSNNVVSIGESAFAYIGINGALPYQDETTGAFYPGSLTYTYFELVLDVANSRLNRIDMFAFGLSGIYNVVLPASINYIGSGAFGGCDVLAQVTIGSAEHMATELNFIGGGAFAENYAMSSFTLYKSVSRVNEVPTLGNGTDLFGGTYGVFEQTDAQIYVPADSVDYYKTAWNTTLNRLAEHIVAIKEA